MNRPTRYAKLDNYDYDFVRRAGRIVTIRVYIESVSDIDVADIASDINDSDGNIYVERHYFRFNGMHTVHGSDEIRAHVDIFVEEL